MKTFIAPVAAEVRQDQESEAAIVQRVKAALSASNWAVGEGASLWTARWAKGRTDEDFGNAVGLSGDKVSQCRRVWDRFRTEQDTYPKLSWSHFYAAVAWDDASECLEWASGMDATVAEMKAWRRAQHPEELLPWPPVDVNDEDDPFAGDRDPFGEGEEGTGTEPGGDGSDAEGEDDETEREGTDSTEEKAERPPRSGREEPPAKSQQELFAEYKAKTVKTLEAGMRVIDDLNGVQKVPQHDKMIDALGKMILTIKSF
jgi:hypothetical protein